MSDADANPDREPTAPTPSPPHAEPGRRGPDPVPLVVDLDGTLLRTDLLGESLFAVLGEKPGLAFKLPGWLSRGKAAFKHEIAQHALPSADTLPYREDVLTFLREQRAEGRSLVLATASHETYTQAVADHLDGLFDRVIGSDATHNRRGEAKVVAIREAVGDTFDYMGDADADVPLVAACRHLYLVHPTRNLQRAAEASGKVRRTFTGDAAAVSGLGPKLKLLRPHQWVKNLLVFVPMIMGHQLDLATFGWSVLGFFAFCFAASAIYILNDLVDIASDRLHPTKRLRPLAAATVTVPAAVKLAPVMLVLAAAASGFAALGPGGLAFPGWVLLYLLLTSAYSFSLKRRPLIDVLLLGWLYTHRVLAGGIVTDIVISPWLLAFSAFIFISLAFAKRYTELHHAPPGQSNARRGYRPGDLPLIGNIGPTSGFIAVLVFCLYLNDLQAGSETADLYGNPWMLWMVVPVLMLWILHVWLQAFRGELDDDPLVFAIRDPLSRTCFVIVAALLVLASI